MTRSNKKPEEELSSLRARVEELEETIRAIQSGEVDALVISTTGGDQVYTLENTDLPYRLFVETMAEGAVTATTDGTILYCNAAFSAILRIPLEKIIGSSFLSYIRPDQQESWNELKEKALAGMAETEIYLQNDGRDIPAHLSVKPLTIAQGTGFSIVVTDLTRQKQDQKLIAEGNLANLILEHAGEALVICDPGMTILRSNPRADELFETPTVNVSLTRLLSACTPLADPDITGGVCIETRENLIQDHLTAAGAGEGTELLVRQSHDIKTVLMRSAEIRDNRNALIGYLFIFIDITERKKAEEALKTSRMKLAEAMNLADLVNWDFDVATGIFTFDDRFYALYGTTTELEGGSQMPAEVYAEKFVHPDDRQVVADEIKKAIEATDPKYVSEVEHRIIRRDGEIRHIVVRFGIIKDEKGRTVKTHGANQDITERIRTEDAIKRNLAFQETISAITSRFTGIYDLDDAINGTLADIGRLSRADRAYLVLLREHGTVMDNTHEWCAKGVSPQIENLRKLPSDMYPWWIKKIQNSESIHITDISKLPPEAKAEREVLEKQDIKSVLILPVFRGDKPAGFMGFDNVLETGEWTEEDIMLLNTASQIVGRTLELQRMHGALKMEEMKYRDFFNTSQDAVFITSKEGKLLDFNNSFVRLFGYDSGKALRKVAIPDLYAHPEERIKHIRTITEHGSTKEYPVDLRKKDGTIINTLISSFARKDENGNVVGFQGTIRDITKHKQMETALIEKTYDLNERIKELLALKTISDLILSSVPPEDMFRGVIDLFIPAMKYPELTAVRIIFDGKEFRSKGFAKSEWKIGKKINIEGKEKGSLEVFYTKKMPDADIGPFCFEEENMIDIICRRLETHISMQLSQEELNNTLNRLENIINFLPDATFVVDNDSKVIAWNNAIERMTGVDRGDILGRGDYIYGTALYKEKLPVLANYIQKQDMKLPEIYKNVVFRDEYLSAESYLPEAFGGKGAHVLSVASILYDENGDREGAIESIRDISKLKKKEISLAESLEEKTVMIHEIHHRVRNNLQIISGLIQLQVFGSEDEHVKTELDELNRRIMSMAKVYELLFVDDKVDYSKINVSELIYAIISDSALSKPLSCKILFDIDVFNEYIDLNTAVSISLIQNELLSSMIRYSFTGRERGLIRISMEKDEEGLVELRVSDDGTGFPDDFDISNPRELGMRLISIIIKQSLKGTIEMVRDHGTMFIIRFKI